MISSPTTDNHTLRLVGRGTGGLLPGQKSYHFSHFRMRKLNILSQGMPYGPGRALYLFLLRWLPLSRFELHKVLEALLLII